MERITVFGTEDFTLTPDRDEVFGWMRCSADLPCFDIFCGAWDQAVSLLAEHAQPRAALCRDGKEQLTVFLTLGKAAEDCVETLFQRREYVLASLLNTLCDQALFQMNHQLSARLQVLLAVEHRYMASRQEPGIDYAPAEQRQRFEPLRQALPGADISQSGVLSPAKSMMYGVTLSSRFCGETVLHDCTRCSQRDCPYRKSPPSV